MPGWSLKLKQTKKITIKLIFVLMAIFLFAFFQPKAGQPMADIFSNVAHAQTLQESLGLEQVEQVTMLGKEDIRLTIAKIIRIVLGFLGITTLVLMIYAGYTIMTAGGDSGKVETGKKILLNATIGLAIVLSSFAIVQFFILKLGEATNFLGQGAGVPPVRQTFLGSGSLGRVVKDHYPFRDQRDIPRNTRISVTFNEGFAPGSVFNDSNGNGTLGDCLTPFVDWNTSCDRLNTDAIKIYKLDEAGNETGSPLDMVALASNEGGSFFTVVMRPVQILGDDRTAVGYSVDLTNNIKKGAEPTVGMFDGTREEHYKWFFYTSTEFDFMPPSVVNVYPQSLSPNQKFPRNTVLQINFSEPMDPTVTQGSAVSFSNILLQNKATNAVPTGSWQISNGYRTAEFVSNQPCGENSCGETMYCLPSNCDNILNPNCSETHATIVRTAQLVSPSSWEAVPFTGVTDMAGNALDGSGIDIGNGGVIIMGADGVRDNKPSVSGGLVNILPEELIPDNYFWNFEIENKIDRSAPYIVRITPPIDQEEVGGNAENSILFSKRMWNWTMDGINIKEKIQSTDIDPLWYKVSTELVDNNKTKAIVNHRIFGPNNEDAYYFTSVSSSVRSLNQNCVYPGRGPVSNLDCTCQEDTNGNLINCTNCIGVTFIADSDTGCLQTSGGDTTQGNIESCLSTMDSLSDWVAP